MTAARAAAAAACLSAACAGADADLGACVAQRPVFHLAHDARGVRPLEESLHAGLVCLERPVVEVGSVMEVASLPSRVYLDVEHLLGDGAALPGLRAAGVLDGVLQ